MIDFVMRAFNPRAGTPAKDTFSQRAACAPSAMEFF
jgi:hypothetical protein